MKPESHSPANVTLLLEAWAKRESGALERIIPEIYAELRRMAELQLRGERSNQTLSAPALVNELYIRLSHMNPVVCEHRAQFFSLACTIMRGFLIDIHRARRAKKRGGGAVNVTLSGVAANGSAGSIVDLLDIDAALKQLALVSPIQAQIVEQRYFGGLSAEESAAALGVSPATVKRHSTLGRAWIKEYLTQTPSRPSPW